jgi:hypothetical protein
LTCSYGFIFVIFTMLLSLWGLSRIDFVKGKMQADAAGESELPPDSIEHDSSVLCTESTGVINDQLASEFENSMTDTINPVSLPGIQGRN